MKSAAGIKCIRSGYAILVQKLDIKSGYTPTGAGHSGSGCVSYYPIAETVSTEIHIHRKVSRFVFNTPKLSYFEEKLVLRNYRTSPNFGKSQSGKNIRDREPRFRTVSFLNQAWYGSSEEACVRHTGNQDGPHNSSKAGALTLGHSLDESSSESESLD